MRSPCHNPGRSGRGERARCSARACCAGWGRAAGEMRVGGPHGRGTLLRPCELCNPARLGTQIPGVVQPGATLSAGSTRVSYFLRNTVVASRWCPVRSLGTKTPFQPRSVLVPFTFQPRSAFPSPVCHWSSDPVILSSLSDQLESQLWSAVPVRVPTWRQSAGADSPGIGGGVFIGARPELVRYHLFLGPWDVRLS